NDGVTWEAPVGLGNLNWIRGVAVLDDAARTILLYARGPVSNYRPAVFASVDYGRTFAIRWQAATDWSGYMWVPRVGAEAAGAVYLAHQGQLRRCDDGGFSCPVVGTIDSAGTEAILAGSEDGAPRLFAAVKVGTQWGLRRSDDAGATWMFVDPLDDFYGTLCASIHNQDVILYGGLDAHRSVDGGQTFGTINAWYEYYDNPEFKLHADIFGLHCWPDPSNPNNEVWYIGTDGGIYRSMNMGTSVQNLSLDGLGISQYYSTLTSSDDPTLLVAGAQDQGYQRGFVQPSTGPGPSTPLTQLISGDYGHLTSKDGTHNVVYSTYPGFVLIQEGAANPVLYTASFPDGSAHAWLPPVVADPLDQNSFFFCAQKLYRYVRAGNSWIPTTYSNQDFAIGSSSYLSALMFAPSDPNRAYAVTDTGRLFYSTDRGVTWAQSSSSAPFQHYFYGSAIDVNPNDPLEVVVGGSGYSTAGVVRSVDGGQTFAPESNGLPQTMVYDLAFAANTGDVYAATHAGAYRWNRQAGLWSNIMSNQAPITVNWSVESVEGGSLLRFGTYGRGVWDFKPGAVSAPRPEDGLGVNCQIDSDCANNSVCLDHRCYVPKNRYVSLDPSDGNAGRDTARRVAIDLNGNDAFDAGVDEILGWMGMPIAVTVAGPEPSPQWLSRIDNVPFYLDWTTVGGGGGATVHLGDCHVSPGHTYLVQSIAQQSDIGDEAAYSGAAALPTAALWGDVTGSGNPAMPPDGVANLADAQSVVLGFQSQQTAPKVWLDLEGLGNPDNAPDFGTINIADIQRAVQGFQAAAYPYSDPCSCAGLAPCP
ncbi:MAG: hypothetical protein ACE5E5_12010, partial [Phycisphaerae bacterium]